MWTKLQTRSELSKLTAISVSDDFTFIISFFNNARKYFRSTIISLLNSQLIFDKNIGTKLRK